MVLTGTHVSRILLEESMVDGEDLPDCCKGVEFEVDGKKYVVRADKEVILSAGAFQSPQILELSGIGHPSILTKAGVDVRLENPNVGENLQVSETTLPVGPTDAGVDINTNTIRITLSCHLSSKPLRALLPPRHSDSQGRLTT